ncbi:hypothetical protein X758_25160 [Mesorhizobium sp. LSHC416B00]|nr:hypothetical protein X761_22725 [Mesorhizobium sp. LSHC424B00]ESX66819.1 hypothetical protein X758_25160 [Mesorhizobium sp. LSHC416B00]
MDHRMDSVESLALLFIFWLKRRPIGIYQGCHKTAGKIFEFERHLIHRQFQLRICADEFAHHAALAAT